MANENEPKYVFCIVKSAGLRGITGEVVCHLKFGEQFRVLADMKDGRYYGEKMIPHGGDSRRYKRYRGFIQKQGFSAEKVVDMSSLFFRNMTEKKIPTAIRFKGKQDGWIDPGERIEAKALAGEWVLTNKGWTLIRWLEKEKEIDNLYLLKELVYALLKRTIQDYKQCVSNLRKGKFYIERDNVNVFGEFLRIREWFLTEQYLKVFGSKLTGIERLEILDNKLGITEEWIREIVRKGKFEDETDN